ncbi:MAG: hypothetical protein NZ893_03320 [Candidatus Aenigmarchaeota archaeon]|nr:hypothetical protein [Candidatus Aenigmarchaeota archaeon]
MKQKTREVVGTVGSYKRCFFCQRMPSETGRQFWMSFLKTKVKVCSACRIVYLNGKDGLKLRPPIGKLSIGKKVYKVVEKIGYGYIILYGSFLAYFTKRIKLRHLYRKENSYPISVSIVKKLKYYNVSIVIVKELDRGNERLLFFYLDDYIKSKIIHHKDYDEQYALPIEKAFKVEVMS